MEKLKLAAGMTGEQKRYAVEAALLLGFQTETATFPVITADGEIPVPENMEELKALWKKSTGGTLKSTNQHQSIQVRSLIWISVRKKGWRRCFRKGIS